MLFPAGEKGATSLDDSRSNLLMPGLDAPPAVYRSKRDGWILVVLWGANVAMLVAAVEVWTSPQGLIFRLGTVASILAVTALVVWVLNATHYILSGSELTVCSGPFRWVIPFETIQEVTPTHNPLSGPALSLDRLLIRYPGRRFGILISPKDKEGFLRNLMLRSPGLVLDGEGLVRQQA